jgi:hypothetical protein
MNRPSGVTGVTSLFPTVVTVAVAHHRASPKCRMPLVLTRFQHVDAHGAEDYRRAGDHEDMMELLFAKMPVRQPQTHGSHAKRAHEAHNPEQVKAAYALHHVGNAKRWRKNNQQKVEPRLAGEEAGDHPEVSVSCRSRVPSGCTAHNVVLPERLEEKTILPISTPRQSTRTVVATTRNKCSAALSACGERP